MLKLTPLPEKVPPHVQGWEGVTLETICLEPTYSFPQIEGEIPQPIDESAELMLTRLGMEIVDDASSCDATLSLNLSGRTWRAFYIGAGNCYTGGEVDGELILITGGKKPLSFPITGSVPLSQAVSVSQCKKDPVDYPFINLWFEPLLDGLVQFWGPQALVWALEIDRLELVYRQLLDVGPVDEVITALLYVLEDEDGDYHHRQYALLLLGEFAPEAKEAIPLLIQTLNNDQDDLLRRGAVRALGKFGPEAKDAIPTLIQAINNDSWAVYAETLEQFTGQDFGNDTERWQVWWEENR